MKDYKARLDEATADLHYCDLVLTSKEAAELKRLVEELQIAGQRPGLAGGLQKHSRRHLEQQ